VSATDGGEEQSERDPKRLALTPTLSRKREREIGSVAREGDPIWFPLPLAGEGDRIRRA